MIIEQLDWSATEQYSGYCRPFTKSSQHLMNEGLFLDGVMISRLGLDVFKLSRLDETTKYFLLDILAL